MNTEQGIIESYEARQTGSGKPYVRFKTNIGYFNCWNSDLSKKLQECVGKTVSMTINTNDKGYKDIRAFTEVAGVPQAMQGSSSNPKLEQEIGYYARKAPDVFKDLCTQWKFSEDPVKKYEEFEALADLSARLMMRMERIVREEMTPTKDDEEPDVVEERVQ